MSADESTILLLEVDYLPADMREALRINARRRLRTFKWIAFACIFTIAAFSFMFFISMNAPAPTTPPPSNPDGWQTLSRLAVFFLIMFTVLFIFAIALRQLYSGIIKERGPQQRHHSIRMTAEHFTDIEPLARHEYKWDAFNRWIETPNLLILYLSANLVIPLPKRCIGSPEHIDQCRQLFRAKIDTPRTARHAFEVIPSAGVLPMPPLQNDPSLPR